MNEFELIRTLTAGLPAYPSTVVGPGDDCAVVDVGLPGQWLLLKTDAVVEGIHFTAEAAPEQVGHKALARCLSDVAAMAGSPVSALITLGLPPDFSLDWVTSVYAGLNRLASRFQVGVVGGETTTSPERRFLSVCVLGTVDRRKCLLRSTAQVGDAIFVTGQLGGSLTGKHLDFEPRLTEAKWLADHFDIHAMIDLSDGLAGDLRHVLAASHVGAELRAAAIPISPAAKQQRSAPRPAPEALRAALEDGEDFELLFTLPGQQAVPLRDAWAIAFPELLLTCIGKITSGPGLLLRDARDQVQEVTQHGYTHFA